MRRLKAYILSLRPQQWIKNSILFSAIFFNGKLFDQSLFEYSLWGFVVFCLISSASYLFNDIVDLPFDQRHPLKKKRPIAAGTISIWEAAFLALTLAVAGLVLAFIINYGLFFLALLFLVLHLFYSLHFKKYALLDIFTIAFSFLIRVLASEVLTGYHLSVWLFFCIFFGSLFIAAAKRHSELVRRGIKTRKAMWQYQERLLTFYVSTFATAAILSYIMFTFLQPPLRFDSGLAEILKIFSPHQLVERKWLILSTPLMVFGISRYAQLVYVGKRGERPEKLITTDPYLIVAIIAWGLLMFSILYL